MNRRDMMKLASLVMLPMMPGAAVASSDSKAPPLRYKVFTVTRPGLNRDVPPGKEPLMWVANSATLIYGEQDAVLVDTFLTVEQCNGLADAIVDLGMILIAACLGCLDYVLEEGTRWDWFGDETTTTCAWISGFAGAGFIIRSLTYARP